MTADEHFDAANVCEIYEDYAAAIEHFTKAIELQPFFPEAYFNRAGDRELEGDIANAIRDYEMAIEQDPSQPTSYICLANVYLRKEYEAHFAPQKAAPLADVACRLTKDQSYEALSTRAKAHAAMGKYQNAIKWQRRAIGILNGTVKVDPEFEPPVDSDVWLADMESELETYRNCSGQTWWQRLFNIWTRS